MKKYHIITLLLFTFGLNACMKSVSLNTLRPAEINVPNTVQKVVLVDRTKYDKDAIGIIEGVLTGEGINEDKDGVLTVFNSLQNSLRNSPRFDVIMATEQLKGQTILGSFPDPLSWSQVRSLTRKYNADALLAVEVFDTDFIVTNGKRKSTRTVENDKGEKVEEQFTEFFAEGIGNARVGIRMYDPSSQSIIDQEIFTQNRTWEASATNLKDALAGLVQKSQATKYLANTVGNSYASKIAPMPVRVTRSYYASPKSNAFLSKGAREASVNQWDNAIRTWKMGLDKSSDAKEMGRMAYNIAIGYEIMGDLLLAHQWAGRAYVDFGEKKGRSYAAALDNRLINEEILDQQLGLPAPSKQENSTKNSSTKGKKDPIKLKIGN